MPPRKHWLGLFAVKGWWLTLPGEGGRLNCRRLLVMMAFGQVGRLMRLTATCLANGRPIVTLTPELARRLAHSIRRQAGLEVRRAVPMRRICRTIKRLNGIRKTNRWTAQFDLRFGPMPERRCAFVAMMMRHVLVLHPDLGRYFAHLSARCRDSEWLSLVVE